MEDHTCTIALVHAPIGIIGPLLAPFPCLVTEAEGGWTRLANGPVLLLTEILAMHGVIDGRRDVVRTHTPCACKTKHALVPAHAISRWAVVLEGTPLAPALRPGAKFLGAYLCGRCRGYEAVPATLSMSEDALAICQVMTWAKSLGTSTSRVEIIWQAGVSLANRASSWNTHVISTLPYPSAVVLPNERILNSFRVLLGKLFPTGTWARRDLASQIGLVLGVKGGPRGPGLVAETAGIAAVWGAGTPGHVLHALPRDVLLMMS